tara:strand:- start:7466 stop:7711 length:246 start_codon:yes stop_codon:yes gene_type:complete
MYIDNYAIVRIVLNLLANYICNYIITIILLGYNYEMEQYFTKFKNNIIRKDETVNTPYVENKTSSDNLKDKMDNLLDMTLT